MYCVWNQDDWVELLPFAEFCYNNTVHSTTKQTLFFAAYYQQPKNNFIHPSSTDPESNNAAAIKIVVTFHAMRDTMKENIKAAQERMSKYYNRKVANEEPKFKVGDWVILNAKNIKTKCPTKKLD